MSSKIQWLWPPGYKGEVYNPVSGCTKVSPGCANCYAESFLKRFPNSPSYSPSFLPGEALIKLHPGRLDRPLHWRDPRCIFVNSVSDLFHEEVPFDFVDRVFAIMACTPQHQYIILTKRPKYMLLYINSISTGITIRRHMTLEQRNTLSEGYWPLKNVWLGTSIENQYWMKQRGDIMKEIHWPNKLASFEPLLGPIDPTGYEKTFQWFVIGGESGSGARPMHPLWASRLWYHMIPHARGFWKQWGNYRPLETLEMAREYLKSKRQRVHFDPKSSTNKIDDRYMIRERSTQVYGGEWTEDRDIHQWPESMKLEEVRT